MWFYPCPSSSLLAPMRYLCWPLARTGPLGASTADLSHFQSLGLPSIGAAYRRFAGLIYCLVISVRPSTPFATVRFRFYTSLYSPLPRHASTPVWHCLQASFAFWTSPLGLQPCLILPLLAPSSSLVALSLPHTISLLHIPVGPCFFAFWLIWPSTLFFPSSRL